MKANKTYISIDTARLLEDCCIDSKYIYYPYDFQENYKIISLEDIMGLSGEDVYPAFTWQEILWEYPQDFFGYSAIDESKHIYIAFEIIRLLQQKKYNEADLCFRKNCILLNK